MPLNLKLYGISMLVAWMSMIDSFAQDASNTEKAPTASKLQIAVTFSPDLTFRTLAYEGELGVDNYFFGEQIKRSETVNFGTHSGISLSYMFGRNLGLQLGIEYSLKGWRRDDMKYFEFANASSFEYIRHIYRYQYLDVPLALVFQTSGDKIRFRATIGLVANVFLKGSRVDATRRKDSDREVRSITDTKAIPVNLSPTVSMGIDMPLGNKLGIRLEPNFQHQVFSQESTSLEVRLWSVGLGLTCYLKP